MNKLLCGCGSPAFQVQIEFQNGVRVWLDIIDGIVVDPYTRPHSVVDTECEECHRSIEKMEQELLMQEWMNDEQEKFDQDHY